MIGAKKITDAHSRTGRATYATLILHDLQIQMLHIGNDRFLVGWNQRVTEQFIQIVFREALKEKDDEQNGAERFSRCKIEA